jgi:cytochrome P450
MARITLAVIMRAIFGLEPSPRAERVRDALLAMTENDGAFSLALMVPALRRTLGPWRAWERFTEARERAYALLREEVALRRAEPDLEQRADILSLLIAARDREGGGLSDDELLDELVTLLIAAHETTATSLSWAFDLLLHHPAALARLRAELREGGEEYLDAVCRETLRVRPVVPLTLRVLTEPLRLGPYELPAGVTVGPCIHLLHRRADLYPQPAAFRPERFLERRPGTYEWIAFGGGTRRCLGASFAPMEMRVVLREVLGAVELEPVSARPARIRRRTVFLVPSGGVRVRVRRRAGDAGRG